MTPVQLPAVTGVLGKSTQKRVAYSLVCGIALISGSVRLRGCSTSPVMVSCHVGGEFSPWTVGEYRVQTVKASAARIMAVKAENCILFMLDPTILAIT